MLFTDIGRAALAAVATAVLAPSLALADDKDNPDGQSIFISPDKSLAFAFTVPKAEDTTDTFFSIRVSNDRSWGAVGLGSDDMEGALVLMIYRDESGKNVTFSPRVSYGNYEPEHFDAFKYEILEGTGVFDDHMIFTARCTAECRSWPARGGKNGYIDTSDKNQKAIYALGPSESFHSNSNKAAIKFHEEFGSFTIDMRRTQGAADVPALTMDSESEGTKQENETSGKSDYKAAIHGALMFFFIVVMMPFGAALLRLGKWAKWHGPNQGVALVGVLGGMVFGILTSFKYQRSRNFNSYHQIIGFIVVAFMLCQFTLGYVHHAQHKKTQSPTKYGRIHLWLGRVILFFGTMNAFFGFALALNAKYGTIIAVLFIVAAIGFLAWSVLQRRLSRRKRGLGGGPLGGPPQGYGQEPWREAGPSNASGSGYPSDPPPGYEAPSAQIGLQPVSPWRSSGPKDYENDPNLGSAQRPREFA